MVGAVAVAEGESETAQPREQLLEAVARSLFESGDDQRPPTEPLSVVTAVMLSGSRH